MVPHFVEDGGTNQDKLYQEWEEDGGHGFESISEEIIEVFFLLAFFMMFTYHILMMTGLFFVFHSLCDLMYRLLDDGKDPDDDVVRDQV